MIIGVGITVISIRQTERLVVVAMVADLAALTKQKTTKVAELLGIGLPFRRGQSVVLVVFDHHTGIVDAVALRQLGQIGPPDLRIKIADAQTVIPPDIGAVPSRHRGRKVVQIKDSAVDDRVSHGVLQQAVGCCIKTAHDFVIDTNVVHHDAPTALTAAPDQGDFLIPGCGIYLSILAQGHCQ